MGAKRGEESAMQTEAVRARRPPGAGRSLFGRMVLQHCPRLGLGVRGTRTCGMQAEPNSVIWRRISHQTGEDASEHEAMYVFCPSGPMRLTVLSLN